MLMLHLVYENEMINTYLNVLLDTTYSPSILTFGPFNPPQNRNHSHSHMNAGPVVCQNGLNEYASLLCKPTLTRKSKTL